MTSPHTVHVARTALLFLAAGAGLTLLLCLVSHFDRKDRHDA